MSIAAYLNYRSSWQLFDQTGGLPQQRLAARQNLGTIGTEINGREFKGRLTQNTGWQNRCQREIDRHQNADKSYKDEGVALLDLARNAQRLFAMQKPREKRHLLNFVLSNCTWGDGEVVGTFRQPFDLLAKTKTTAIAASRGAGNTANSAKSEIWLPFLDTYRTMCLAPQPHFRRVLEDVRAMQLAA